MDPQILHESTNQLKASTAVRDQAIATIKKAKAELDSRRAALDKAEVDVRVAKADLKVAESEERRLKAWVGYLTLTAPYDGIITARNANTFDFVLPTTGDPSATRLGEHPPHLSPSGAAAPIYVVERTDKVRIFIDIHEADANYVKVGTRATVLVKGYRDEPIPAEVTRTSWALNSKSRTLRAEIDLKNPGSQLLPGMYAYAKVIIDRPGVHALPVAALMHLDDGTLCDAKKCERLHSRVNSLMDVGEKTYCWLYEGGHSVRAEVRTGVSDGEWIEITDLHHTSDPAGADRWTPVDGKEQVILGDLTLLAEGGPVTLPKEERRAEGTKVASATPTAGHRPTETHPGVAAGTH
jgi:multidrug efflux pump subunit AcrA (membrane-fusion protein)